VQAEPRALAEAVEQALELGRSSIADGYTLRVAPEVDLAALSAVIAFCQEHLPVFGARGLRAIEIRAIARVGQELDAMLSVEGDAPSDGQGSADALDIQRRAANFASSRRKAIARVARGGTGLRIRHAFGLGRLLDEQSEESISMALTSLLEGRRNLARTLAAAQITREDVAKARGLMRELRMSTRSRDERAKAAAQAALRRRVRQTAIEVFLDLFAAGCEAGFDDQPLLRVQGLSLVPRREEGRRVAVEQGAPAREGEPLSESREARGRVGNGAGMPAA
jgi:hypothetical protein